MNALPRLPDFDYFIPETISEASQFLSSNGNQARLMLGGTDLLVQLREQRFRAKYLVDLKGLEGVNEIDYDTVRGLRIGSAVNMNRVIAFPAVRGHYQILAQAAESVASYQLRSRATIVGNICNASPAGDTIGACLLLEGMLNIYGADGIRRESLKNFFVGPGQTTLMKGDIVTSIEFPVPPAGLTGRYIKLGRNRLSDLAIVGITVVGYPDSSSKSGYRIKLALASVAPTPLAVDRIEELLSESPINEEILTKASIIATEACKPIDDIRSSAQYRRYMVRNLSLRAMQEVWNDLSQFH